MEWDFFVLSFPVYESHSGSWEDEASVGGVTAAVSSSLKVVIFPSGENQ